MYIIYYVNISMRALFSLHHKRFPAMTCQTKKLRCNDRATKNNPLKGDLYKYAKNATNGSAKWFYDIVSRTGLFFHFHFVRVWSNNVIVCLRKLDSWLLHEWRELFSDLKFYTISTLLDCSTSCEWQLLFQYNNYMMIDVVVQCRRFFVTYLSWFVNG